jgi:hypothetical protein
MIRFTFDNINGNIHLSHNATYITWGGMGFHLECADHDLRQAIEQAIVKHSG